MKTAFRFTLAFLVIALIGIKATPAESPIDGLQLFDKKLLVPPSR